MKDIINRMPSSWEELKFNQFKELIKIPITEENENGDLFLGIDNSLKALAVLTGKTIEELESTPLEIINQMATRIAFLTKEPSAQDFKTSIKWKNLKEITYDNYVTFITLAKQNLFDNLGMLLSAFSSEKLTEEEIENLPTSEVLAGFFLLERKLKKFIKSSIIKTSFRLLRLTMKQMSQTLFRRKAKK